MLCAFSFLLLAISTEGDAFCILFLFIILYTMSYLGMIQLSELEAFKKFCAILVLHFGSNSLVCTYIFRRELKGTSYSSSSYSFHLFAEEMFLFWGNKNENGLFQYKDFMNMFMRIDTIYIYALWKCILQNDTKFGLSQCQHIRTIM